MAETISPDVAAAVAFREAVAAEVRAAVGRRNTNSTALARRLGVSQTYVWRRLKGEVAFDTDDLHRIAGLLGVAVSDLLPSGAHVERQSSPDYPQVSVQAPSVYPYGGSVTGDVSRRSSKRRTRRISVRPHDDAALPVAA